MQKEAEDRYLGGEGSETDERLQVGPLRGCSLLSFDSAGTPLVRS